jgi:DNA-binding GntR family transcriptional regulator
MSNRPPIPGTTQQHALDWLRQAIVAGDLQPGARVPQDEVATQLGVSLAPVREALRVLEQEGQLTYLPRRGYFVTELRIDDLEEIYELRRVLEERAAREALTALDDDAVERIVLAAKDCADAASAANVTAEIAANRSFHFAILEACERPHLLRLIGLLWESTEAYRALYYNSPAERVAATEAHDRIIAAIRARDGDRLVRELDDHRARALRFLSGVLGGDAAAAADTPTGGAGSPNRRA